MAEIKRRDAAPRPRPTKESKEPNKPETTSAGVSRREFLVGSGAGIAGLVIGGVVGNRVIPQTRFLVRRCASSKRW